MKAMAALGLVLALFFAVIAVVAVSDLQTDADAISGLSAPADSFFNISSTLAVIVMIALFIIGLIGAVALLRH